MSKCCLFIVAALLVCPGPLAWGAPVTPHPRLAPLPALDAPAPTLAIAPAASAAAGPSSTLYDGQTVQDAGLTLAPWGGGSVKDDTSVNLDGTDSLSVTTVDLYQGGRINFTTPPVLGDLSDPTHYLQMKLRFPKAVVDQTPQEGFGGFGGFGRGRRGRRGRGGFGGPGGPGGPDDDNGADDQPPYNPDGPPVLTTLRWVFTLADGRQAEILRPLPEDAVMGKGWFSLAVPLSVLKFTGGTPSGQNALKSILVTADGYSQFNIGEIQVVTDNQPLDALAGDPQDVNASDTVTLHGTGDGGASMLKYAWDFDTHGPFVDQAEGQTVTTQYDTGGKDYTVTLMVSDLDGIKKPVTTTTTVHVH